MNLKSFLFNFKPLNVLRIKVFKHDDVEPVLEIVLDMHDAEHLEKLNLICSIYGIHLNIVGFAMADYSCETKLYIVALPNIISEFCSDFDDFLLRWFYEI